MAQQKVKTFYGYDRELSSLAKSLSHPARVAILLQLASVKGCSCANFVEALPLAQATVSQHLSVLVKLNLVIREQKGTMSCYSINTEKLERLSKLVQDFLSCMKGGFRIQNCCK
ncbi:MAG: helix-turn-helix transcriptional regulator [Ignavibacteriales bacterium]|nr:helix-turn-helix transcriptional regulator [Ignavibacteriales bacterium]